jgi:TPR repeat protein
LHPRLLSCCPARNFTDRSGNDPPQPLTSDIVTRLLEKPSRDIITAGLSNQRAPARSPIPDLFLAALSGAADPYRHGVVSTREIHAFLLDRVLQMRDINLTPQQGRLSDSAFAEGTFLFRVTSSTVRTPDENESVRLYRANAAEGDTFAQVNLAFLYDHGRGGLPRDEREAARLYKLAADQGNTYAQTNLGTLYEKGRGGLPRDEREAARLSKLAADKGDAYAQANLASLYSDGRDGVPKAEREAARLYKLAADRGVARAQNDLGTYYRDGRGGLGPVDSWGIHAGIDL